MPLGRVQDELADAGQDMDMLMPVDKGRGAAKDVGERRELPIDLPPDRAQRRRSGQRHRRQPVAVRQYPIGRQFGIGVRGKRVGQREVQPDLAFLHGQQVGRRLPDMRFADHRGDGGQHARTGKSKDRVIDGGAATEIVRTQDQPDHCAPAGCHSRTRSRAADRPRRSKRSLSHRKYASFNANGVTW
jgi:hypothetical protein